MSTLYTVMHKDGALIDQHLPLMDAALLMLTYDGNKYAIREEDGVFELYVAPFSQRCGSLGNGLTNWFDYAATTEEGVYLNIIKRGGWNDSFAYTDEEYNRMMAEATAEAEGE